MLDLGTKRFPLVCYPNGLLERGRWPKTRSSEVARGRRCCNVFLTRDMGLGIWCKRRQESWIWLAIMNVKAANIIQDSDIKIPPSLVLRNSDGDSQKPSANQS
jgi:hypothetical protein